MISTTNSSVLSKLYKYQYDIVQQSLLHDKGIFCIPTGTGKSFCESAIIADDIINNTGFNMYVINAPRIVLTYQLLKEVYNFLSQANIEARFMFVHSGGKINEQDLEDIRIKANIDGANIPFAEIESGTNPYDIRKMIIKAKRQNLPLIFFSTYNSANRIEEARQGLQPISIVLNDEAHYLVQEQFHDILRILQSKRCYFFTATTISTSSDCGTGMNNVDAYGEVLYSMTPIEAIQLGKMVRPRLHFIITDNVYNADDYNKSLNKIIKDSFKQHGEILVKTSPKLLVSAKGTQDIVNFIKSKEYKELIQSGVDIYAVASNDNIGNNINGEQVRRQDFLKRLKLDGQNPNKKLIVLHYDILSEGIDVSGFSGIMPLRTLSKSKFLQTYGRAARLDDDDRYKIDSKLITPHNLELMNKPFGYVLIPNIYTGNFDDKDNIVNLINELRSYGFKPNEDIICSSITHGISEINQPDTLNELSRTHPQLGRTIEYIQAELEAETDAKLDKFDLLKTIFN
jgi:superfamily II DNA or RNA helicase